MGNVHIYFSGIKPYKCEKCNYSTVERSHLKVHIRIHTGRHSFLAVVH